MNRRPVYGPSRGRSDGFRQRRSEAEDQSFRGRSSSSSDDQSWKRTIVRHNAESANTRARPEERSRVTASALQLGKVLNLDLKQGYGFLAPVQTVAPSNNVYFRFAGASNVDTGMEIFLNLFPMNHQTGRGQFMPA